MNLIYSYIDRHIIWVLSVSLLFWFGGWMVSGFPPVGLLVLLGFGFYFYRGFKSEMATGISPKPQSIIHKGITKFILFLVLFYILAGVSKIVASFILWTSVWITRGESVADEMVRDNYNLMNQLDYFVSTPVMIIMIMLYVRYLIYSRRKS